MSLEKAKKLMDDWQVDFRKRLKHSQWLNWILFILNANGAAQNFFADRWWQFWFNLGAMCLMFSLIARTDRMLKRTYIERK